MSRTSPSEPASRTPGHDPDVQWALDLAGFVNHPLFAGMAFTAGLGLAGAVVLVVSGIGIGHQSFVALQVPYLVSGGIGAVGLLIVGAFLASVLGERRDGAEADREVGELGDQVADLARLVGARVRAGRADT